mmetsp:Transcript_7900/g.11931  ORF Transcript_7900/g.11931 Transcript_7900/m.11931 type:complete len:528 (-) Transcript_7900:125-1708(-)
MTENVTSLLELPSALVGYERSIAITLCVVLAVVLIDLHLRRKMKRKKLVNPKKAPAGLPEIIPYQDPIYQVARFFALIFSGQGSKVRDPKYLMELNMASEKKHGGMCRQSVFMGIPMVVSWSPDHFRDVSMNIDDYGKVMGFSKHFDDISKRSILMVEGQEWKDQKRLIHPAFKFTHIKNQIPKFNEIARRLTTQLGNVNGPVEMLPWTSKATLDGLSMAGFGLDMGALLDQNTEAYEVYLATMSRLAQPVTLLPGYESLPIESNRKWFENIRIYVKYLSDLVGEKRLKMLEEERKGEVREDKDILDLLIAARDEDESTGLTNEELLHNLNLFFIAGHETSSSTVAFATHMLAENPDLQDQMYQEIQSVIGDREPNNDDFPSLKFTGRFLKEVTRLYPAAVGMMRKTKKDVQLGDYHVDEGTLILLSSYNIHRHPKYWERPDEFWPDRFLPENSKGRHPFALTPFSAGPRACIGKQFALVEMKILLIHLVQTFKVLKNPEDKIPFTDDIGLVLRPPKGSTVILERRK